MQLPHSFLRGLARTTEALVVSSWFAARGGAPTTKVASWLDAAAPLATPAAAAEGLLAAAADAEPLAAIEEGAWRAATTIEAVEGLAFAWEGDFAPPARVDCFDAFCSA